MPVDRGEGSGKRCVRGVVVCKGDLIRFKVISVKQLGCVGVKALDGEGVEERKEGGDGLEVDVLVIK